MISKVMLTMESRIHGDMYVRFGGRLAETYHRKVEKRCGPSLLKEIADFCGIKKILLHTLLDILLPPLLRLPITYHYKMCPQC